MAGYDDKHYIVLQHKPRTKVKNYIMLAKEKKNVLPLYFKMANHSNMIVSPQFVVHYEHCINVNGTHGSKHQMHAFSRAAAMVSIICHILGPHRQ